MRSFSAAPVGASIRGFAVSASAFLIMFPLAAYDIEFDAGTRAGSFLPSAVGAAFWDAAALSGPFAAGTTGNVEASIDADGKRWYGAALRADASYSSGRIVSGARVEASAADEQTGEQSESLVLSTPFTINGAISSFSGCDPPRSEPSSAAASCSVILSDETEPAFGRLQPRMLIFFRYHLRREKAPSFFDSASF